MREAMEKERVGLVRNMSLGARINYEKLAKRVNTRNEEETRVKQSNLTSSNMTRTNMTAFLTKCSCKTTLNDSTFYQCDVHKHRNASLSQLSINLGMQSSQFPSQRDEAKGYETLPLKNGGQQGRNNQFRRLNYLTHRGEAVPQPLKQSRMYIGSGDHSLREDLDETI